MDSVFVTHELPGGRIEELRDSCIMDVWTDASPMTAADLTRRLRGQCGVLCSFTNLIDEALLDANPQLRFISSMSVGLDHVDLDAATARGIPVGYTPDVLVETTADANFALILAAARRIAEADRYIRAGQWRAEKGWSPDFFVGKDVGGATLGVVGLGKIGQAVARRGLGFGMRVLAWNRSEKVVPGVKQVSLEELLSNSDFVSINVALTESTHHLLNADRIALMKDDAVLVNTARGGIVDETALADALQRGTLAAAGLDVFEQEPVASSNPLLSLPNVVVTPHLGSGSMATRIRMADLAVENVIAALQNKPMPNCINKEVYGR